MKERVARLVGPAVEGMPWLGTFHSIGAQILRRHAELVGLKPNFTILDTDDQIRLMKQLLEAENIDEKRWPARAARRLHRRLEEPRPDPRAGAGRRGRRLRRRPRRQLYAAYQERLKTLNAADFGDLLLAAIRLFREHADVLAEYQRRFRYMLVDEYQDTNVAQYLWLRPARRRRHEEYLLRRRRRPVDLRLARRRGRQHPALRAGFSRRARSIRLERNYRSTGHILGAASGLIANNKGRLGKTLWTEDELGEKVERHRRLGPRGGGALGRRGDRGAAARRQPALDEIAILVRARLPDARVRGALHHARPALPRHRRPALLRARRRSATPSPICASSCSPPTTSPSSASSTCRKRGIGDATMQVAARPRAAPSSMPLMRGRALRWSRPTS